MTFSTVSDLSEESELYCSLQTSLQGNPMLLFLYYFLLSVSFITIADTLSLMTIYKLRKDLNAVIQPEPTDKANMNSIPPLSRHLQAIKTRQHRVIITVMLILVFFSLTLWPVIVVYMTSLLRMRVQINDRAIVYHTIFYFCVHSNYYSHK